LGSVRIRTASLTRALNLVTVRRRAARLLLLRLTISSVHEVGTLLFAIAGLTVCALLLTPFFVLICELGRGAVLHALVLLATVLLALALALFAAGARALSAMDEHARTRVLQHHVERERAPECSTRRGSMQRKTKQALAKRGEQVGGQRDRREEELELGRKDGAVRAVQRLRRQHRVKLLIQMGVLEVMACHQHKQPAQRQHCLDAAARVPVGEDVAVAQRHGHVQEVIVQNFRAKPRTAAAGAPDASLLEYAAAVAVTRIVMGPGMRVQVPPNLSDPAEFGLLVRAGIDDWGGVSPLTADCTTGIECASSSGIRAGNADTSAGKLSVVQVRTTPSGASSNPTTP
jgi:hypothetical protein